MKIEDDSMSKKKSSRPHGHYCKICDEYKANEKFSGKGHAAHICKACSKLSAAEKAEAMTINRLMNFPMGRLSESDKKWLENRVHDRRPEVAELAREVYNAHFPYAERNRQKKQLIINTLAFEIHTEVFDEYGDELPVNVRFTADRHSRVLTMTDFDRGGVEQSLTLDGKKMSTLLRWAVHSLEIFMWPEDYGLIHPRGSIPLDFELFPDDWDEEEADEDDEDSLDDEDAPELEGEASWRVDIEYSNHTSQEIVSYQDYLLERPEELYLALLEYFVPETDDFDEEYEYDGSLL
jgi:hypothetical protein